MRGIESIESIETLRTKVIEYDDREPEWHVHYGYEHNEDAKTHWSEMSISG